MPGATNQISLQGSGGGGAPPNTSDPNYPGSNVGYPGFWPAGNGYVVIIAYNSPTPQTITFPNPGNSPYGSPVTLRATASSGLTVSYSVVSGPATVSGTTLTPTGTGSVTVQASQAGNSTYAAATPVSVTFTVNPEPQTVGLNPGTQTIQAGQSINFTASGSLNGSYVWGGTSGASGGGSSNTVTFNSVGSYTVTVYAPASTNYAQSSAASVTINVNAASTTFSGSPTSFVYSGASQGPTITPNPSGATYGTSGTVSAIVPGSYSFTATANGNYSGSSTINWTISPASQSTVSISPTSATVTLGQSTTFTASGGSGTGAYTWGGSGSGTGSSKSVTFNTTATSTVTVYQAADSNYNASNTATATITVNNPPPPVISSGTSAAGISGNAFSYQITASNSPASYSITSVTSNLPNGVSLNASTGLISGTPTQTGTFNVSLNATNPGGTGTSPLTITINPPAPVISSASTASGVSGTAFSYQIAASNSPTTYSVTGYLPNGLSVNTSTGLISGTPTQTGGYTVTLGATNVTGTGTISFTVTIYPPPPVISSATSAITVSGSAFSYQIAASNSPTTYSVTGNLPPGISLNTSTGVLSGNSTQLGSYSLTLGASNAGGTGTQAFTLTVNPPAPVITSATNTVCVAGSPLNFQITATNSPTSYSVTGNLPPGISLNTSTGVLSGTTSQQGTYPLTLGATNVTGTGTQTFYLVFNPTTPTITSATSAAGTTGVAFSYQIVALNSPTSYSVNGALPSGLSLNTSTGVISGTPTQTGNFSVTLGATNMTGTGTSTLALTIVPPAPVITSATSATGTTGVAFSYQIVASNNPTSYVVTGTLPTGLSLNSSSGVISGTPTQIVSANLNLSATNAGGTGTSTLAITINPPQPVVSAATPPSGITGQAYTYTISATNNPTSYVVTGSLPPGLALAASTGIISGTPTTIGAYPVTLQATNAGGTGQASVTFTVNPLAPVVTSGSSVSATAGQSASYQITGTNNPTSYAYTWVSAATGTATLNPTSGLLQLTPSTTGTYTLSVTATNSGGTSPAKTVTLTVAPPVPVITSSATATMAPGQVGSYQITASNSPTTYAYSWTGTSAGVGTFNAATGLLALTPTAPGTYTLSVTATNAAGTSAPQTVALTVGQPTPAITSPTTLTLAPASHGTYQIAATNHPTTYGFAWVGNDPGGTTTFNPSTGVVSLAPQTAGSYTFTVTATNAQGSVTQNVTLTVSATAAQGTGSTGGSGTSTGGYGNGPNGSGSSSNPDTDANQPNLANSYYVNIDPNNQDAGDVFQVNKGANTPDVTTLFTVNEAGNVGIGTQTPMEALSVNGPAVKPVIGVTPIHTPLYSTYENELNTSLEIGAAGTPTTPGVPRLVLSNFGGTTVNTVPGEVAFALPFTNGVEKRASSVSSVISADSTSAVTGDLLLNTASNGTLSEKMRVTAAGNVGIGTATPNAALTVNGVVSTGVATNLGVATNGDIVLPYGHRIYFANNVNNNATSALSFGNYGGDSNALVLGNSNGGTWPQSLQFVVAGPYPTNSAERMRIASNGNIGIGITSPNALLDIAGNGVSTDFRISRAGNINAYLSISSQGGAYNSSNFTVGGNNALSLQGNGGAAVGAYSGGGVQIPANGLIVSGNVGIGTTTPTSKLQVTAGDIAIDNGKAIRSGGDALISNNGTNLITVGSSNPLHSVAINAGGLPQVLVQPTGNVGIGITSPQAKLQVDAPTTNGAQLIVGGAQTSNDQYLLFRDPWSTNNGSAGFAALGWNDTGNGGDIWLSTLATGQPSTTAPIKRFLIDQTGNVGIGITTPAARLQLDSPLTNGSQLIIGGPQTSADQYLLFRDAWNINNGVAGFAALGWNDTGNGGNIWLSTLGLGQSSSATPIKRFLIDQSGNVGIGTTTPTNKLSVAGSVGLNDVYVNGTDNSNSWHLTNSGGSLQILQKYASGLEIPVASYSADQYGNTFTGSAGWLSIGTWRGNSPIAPLDVESVAPSGEVARFEPLPGQNSSWSLNTRSYISVASQNPQFWWEMSVQDYDDTTNHNGFALRAGDSNAGGSKKRLYISPGSSDLYTSSYMTLYNQNTDFGWEFSTEDSAGSGGGNGLAFREYVSGASTPYLYIADGGKVGIGTESPDQLLSVNGTIHAREVIVDNNGWSDYVFDKNYRLAPLKEVEKEIHDQKHLPGIPSASDVAKNGVSLGDMQAKLLATVEEMTLRLIDQEKRLDDQAKQMRDQNERITQLERENEELKANR